MGLKCKIFQSRSIEKLEEGVNQWLSMQVIEVRGTQFSTIKMEDGLEYWLIHTLIIFYIPMESIG